MRRMSFFALLAAFLLVLTGCFSSSATKQDDSSQPAGQAAEPSGISAEPDATTATSSNAEKNAVKKFYPESSTATAEKESESPERNFVVTQELQAKIHLVDKYNPGICYGIPAPVPASAVAGMIERNPELAQFLRDRYSLPSDLAVYEKIKQLNGIMFETLSSGKYKFNFTDGQCCFLKAYEGEVTIIGQTVSDEIIRTESKENPC